MSASDDLPGDLLELQVGPVAHGGVFVARHEGRVVFVADAVPGERVRARLTDTGKKRFWRAETIEVLEASPDRRAHVWPEAAVDRSPEQRAGGAEFGHITPERQRTLKAEVLRDSLKRFGGLEASPEVEALPGPGDGTRWRTRVTLQVDADGSVGPYAARSHTVVPVSTLPLATLPVQEAVDLTARVPGAKAVRIVQSQDGVRVHVVDDAGSEPGREIRERVGERVFRLAEGGFWQVHEHAAATLTDAVKDAVDAAEFDPTAANLDLYGGVGLLAAAVGDRFGRTTRITSVEADARATEYAQENLADWVGARAVTARVDRFVDELGRTAGRGERERLSRATVVLDPPRSGAGQRVMAALTRLAPAQLVYVACDPVALSRDLAVAREAGYRLRSLRAFDLFPGTHHVEAVAALSRD